MNLPEDFIPTPRIVEDILRDLWATPCIYFFDNETLCSEPGQLLGGGWVIKNCGELIEEGSYFQVFSLSSDKNHLSYWKVPGTNDSYDGLHLNFHQIHEVEPYEKKVMSWRKI